MKYLLTAIRYHGTIKEYQVGNRTVKERLEKAVELLQDRTFDVGENFWSELGGDVTAEYTVKVVDPETLLNDVNIDLDGVTDEDNLHDKVEDGLYSIMDYGGSDGVEAY